MDNVLNLKCLICGKEYQPHEVDYVCPDHGTDGILDVQYDYDLIRRRISQGDLLHNTDHTIWRYRPLLPVQPDISVPPLAVGWTPLYRADRLAADLGLQHLWVKDDGRQPTASFKDRASADKIVASLKPKGFPAFVTEAGGLFAVRVGSYADRGEAERVQAKLRDREKLQSYIVKQ